MTYTSIWLRISALVMGRSIDFPSDSDILLENMRKISQYMTATKDKKVVTVCINRGMFCWSVWCKRYENICVVFHFECTWAQGTACKPQMNRISLCAMGNWTHNLQTEATCPDTNYPVYSPITPRKLSKNNFNVGVKRHWQLVLLSCTYT